MLAHQQQYKKQVQDVDRGHRLHLWRETLYIEQAVMNDHQQVILHMGSWECHWQLLNAEG